MKTHTDIFENEPDLCIQAVLRTLDTQVEQYDVTTQMRLNEARARAIAAVRAKVPFWRSRSILGAAFAFSAAVAFVVLTHENQATSAELEATALYEATFGAGIPDDTAVNAQAFADSDQPALDAAVFDAAGLDEAGLDETVVANDLEFYAWLSEGTNAERVPAGSGS